ncbi:AMP-binding protein [Azospirillum sp. RWY-5-1]|uniref:AMP-binding protein n=1 Tax=Azospirillum oleiclasticum TaxID=2735135 RepID=A0ABX2TEW3_9PROT|nr:AMP-binding protein [Azospirillum oleiclasticum]NYZ14075.1 AMP-binding protein [Azospirillum oleiclasticum]NYZ21559.1 AMP-binding protein [Azospirillum oleiclasticum]
MAGGIVAALLRLLHRVEVRGIEAARGVGGCVVVATRRSTIDALLIASALPEPPVILGRPDEGAPGWARRALDRFERVGGLRAAVRAARAGRCCLVLTGDRPDLDGVAAVYGPAALIAGAAGVPVLPLHIDGSGATPHALVRWPGTRRFPKIALTVGTPRRLSAPAEARGRARRVALAEGVYDALAATAFAAFDLDRSVFDALLDARRRFGHDTPILEDAERHPMGFGRLVLGSVALGRALARTAARGEVVGVLLPNANAAALTIFGLHAFGRVPAMLNYSMGAETLVSACRTGRIGTIVTSRRFIALGRLDRIAEALGAEARLVYLEDLRKQVGPLDKLWGLAVSRVPWLLRGRTAPADSPAVLLFTSGSEGAPKGVVLSHANILANVGQVGAVVELVPQDRAVDPLPLFHSFGLTAGMLFPLLHGVPVCLYPSPLHYRAVAELVADDKATLLFATDTFLAGYGRAASDGQLSSVRYAVVGAEPVRDGTRRLYRERFGVEILEGYGATETAPVLAVNTPTHSRPGTVGRFLPGIAHRLEPVEGITDGGRLAVSGPNVMHGYYLPEEPGVLRPPAAGWHETGDIVAVDGDGYVRIVGRFKRFAKIAGEMVSLAAVEALAGQLWADESHVALGLPDTRKGERVVLLTTRAGAGRDELAAFARERGMPELMVPKTVLWVDSIPTLGSGKADYPAVRRMAENALSDGAERRTGT